MDVRGYQHYRQDAVFTMTPSELLLTLYDELVKRVTQAELALDKKDYGLYEASVQRSIEIIRYLDATLDRKYPISKNLAQLYEYISYELGRAKIGRRAEVLLHAKSMITELRDTFRQAQKNNDSGR